MELGVDKTVPTLRQFGEHILKKHKTASMIRINEKAGSNEFCYKYS